jgi:phosphate transport system substrate-binding protein
MKSLAFVGAILVFGCTRSEPPAPAPAPLTVNLTGAGSTLAAPLYAKWVDAFAKTHPDVRIQYQPLGSTEGIREVSNRAVDFGATDAPMTEDEMAAPHQQGWGIYHLPVAVGGVVPAYNLPGVSGDVRFTPEALAGIFLGRIKKWNDPALAQTNPGAKLPDAEIVAVHRSDGSGTTYVWSDYLSAVSAEWRARMGRNTSLAWNGGAAAKGNEGVALLIKQTPFAIGYLETLYAVQSGLTYGAVRNASGNFVKANTESERAAAEEVFQSRPEDYRISLVNGPAKGGYPISCFTWLLVPNEVRDSEKQKALVEFLRWGLSDGQSMAESLAYARLPQQVVKNELQTVSRIQYVTAAEPDASVAGRP